jgi:8-oxo-dGTP pyrophosphatase MutT (NUDIX family)
MSDHGDKKNYPKYPPGLGFPEESEKRKEYTSPKLQPLGDVQNNRVLIRTYGKGKGKKEPILSCGVICLKRIEDILHVLLIRRKDSLAYVEFVRGKYKPSDPHYIRELVDGMSKKERKAINNKEFIDLWREMWISKSYKRHRPEYEKSFHRFESIKENIREYIINHPENGWDEPEWGFPKGRPNKEESVIDCAMREFKEETGIPKEKLKILNNNEYEENYTGTNGISYKNHYVIGTCDEEYVGVNPRNYHQAKEVSAVKWVPLDDAYKYVRDTYPSRLMILKNASEWFIEKYSE